MKRFKIQIDTILPGWGVSEYFITKGQFQNSIGIDPEMPKTDSDNRPSGLIRPTAMAKFSGTEITGVPMWILTNNKNTNSYVYASDGKVHVFDADLSMTTALSTPTSGAGNGAEYYNNYLYFATPTDISRYGPLNGSASMTNSFWTSTLSLTALANTTYPTVNGVKIPNHPMYLHPKNNRLYFGDVNSNGIGILSFIKTKKGTYEGDTNDTTVPSAYNALDFYYGWYPTCISSVGTELAIGLINQNQTTTSKVKQKNAQVAFWSTLPSDTSYNRIAELPDPLITAMINVNGQLYVFSGNGAGGMRISRYLGGESFEELYYASDQYPPMQGAVDCLINRLVWGVSTTSPATSASVMALGSKVRAMAMGVHNILKTTSTGTSPIVGCLKYIEQGASKQPVVGWSDGTAKGLDKLSTTYGTSIFRSQVYALGNNGIVKNIRIPLSTAVGANHSIAVKLYIDDGSSNSTIDTINNTNHSGKRFINISPMTRFDNNFYLEFTWSGSALLPIAFPIIIEGDLLTDY